MKYKFLYYKGKRPNNTQGILKQELINYIRVEFKKNHHPSRREIEQKFHLRLNTLFVSINSLYNAAGLKYKLCPNQHLKSKKANLMLNLIIQNLNKWGLILVKYRQVTDRGIDIIANKDNERIGIELKAYNKNEMLKRKDVNQVVRFIKKENLKKAIIITTTDLQQKNIEPLTDIIIIKYKKLCEIFTDPVEIRTLRYIREKSVNSNDITRKIKKDKILKYVLNAYKQKGKKPGYHEILTNLKLDIYTYFKSLFEIYKILKIPPPLKNMGGRRAKKPDQQIIELWKNEFKKYILKEVKKGKFPTGEKISSHFKISHIWNIVKVSELYDELNLEPYLKRKKRLHTS